MRLPWQRRVTGQDDLENAVAPEPARHAWRTLPVLHARVDANPPLTAGSVELADSLSRRLRSTGERSPLVHRSGLPEAASPGTVRGLVTASAQAQRARARQRDQADVDGDGLGGADKATSTSVASPPAANVVARQRPKNALTSVDATLAATLRRVTTTHSEHRVDEDEPHDDPAEPEAQSPVTPQPGLSRTIIRRRPGSSTPRPLGLQAPLSPDATAHAARDAATSRAGEQVPSTREAAPRTVAATVGRIHRSDVSDVQVRRDREADMLAASEHARAVTRGGEVFIPASEGPLDSGRGSGLLAHELTHVIQQRRLGRSVPLEHSPAGRRLEADAALTERHVRGDLGATAPQPTASTPSSPAVAAPAPVSRDDSDDAATAHDIQEDLIASGRALRMPDGSLVFPGAGGHLPEQRATPMQTPVAIQRAPDGPAIAEAPSAAPVPAPTAPPGPGAGVSLAPAFRPAPGITPTLAQAPPAAAPTALESASTPQTYAPAPVIPAAAPVAPAAEEAAPIDLDDLARRVYGHVRTQLRSELLIDRERAGLLTDFR